MLCAPEPRCIPKPFITLATPVVTQNALHHRLSIPESFIRLPTPSSIPECFVPLCPFCIPELFTSSSLMASQNALHNCPPKSDTTPHPQKYPRILCTTLPLLYPKMLHTTSPLTPSHIPECFAALCLRGFPESLAPNPSERPQENQPINAACSQAPTGQRLEGSHMSSGPIQRWPHTCKRLPTWWHSPQTLFVSWCPAATTAIALVKDAPVDKAKR